MWKLGMLPRKLDKIPRDLDICANATSFLENQHFAIVGTFASESTYQGNAKNALKKKDFQPFLGKAIDWENIDAKKIYSEISQIAASLILLLLFVSQQKVPLSVIETIWKNHWRILHIQSLISFVIFIWKRTKIYKSVLSTIILIGMQCMHKNVIANWNETKLSFRMFMLRWIGERVRLPMKSHKNQFPSIFP